MSRHHDAGVLSVGIDPNWKHIVPPGQRRVVSEAHCVADCTQQALPSRGINVFAVNLHTHLLGKSTASAGHPPGFSRSPARPPGRPPGAVGLGPSASGGRAAVGRGRLISSIFFLLFEVVDVCC